IHPGGVVITPRPIENYVPLQRAAKGVVITQFEKDAAEHIGLVKIDLLGNRALATVDAAQRSKSWSAAAGRRFGSWEAAPIQSGVQPPHSKLAARRRPTRVYDPPLNDPDTIALLPRGDTLGVSQLQPPAT